MTERVVRTTTDRAALDAIAEMLRDPEWSVGMLEDIADISIGTGRSIQGTCGSCGHAADESGDKHCSSDGCPCEEHAQRPTWDRH
jgi:hypothetical protein